MFETMIPSPLSIFAVFGNKFQVLCRFLQCFQFFVVLCRSLRCLVINLKSFVVPSYVRDYDSKSFVVLCGV